MTTPAQNLLGINNLDKAAGFWTDNKGNTHGFIVEINTQSPNTSKFIEIPPTTFPGAVAIQATSITNVDRVCGFWTDANGNNQGFTGFLNQMFFPFNISIPGMIVTSTSPFGCNDPGGVVGSFIDNKGNTHGFIFDGMTTHLFDAPGSSQKAAFGVAGTVINGINNQGEIVGFFSDGTNVNGFVDFAPPLDQ